MEHLLQFLALHNTARLKKVRHTPLFQDLPAYGLTRHSEPPVAVEDEKMMFRLIRASFNQRRKTLANGLTNAPDIPLSKEEIQESILELGVPVTIRGEALTLEQFAKLSNIVTAKLAAKKK